MSQTALFLSVTILLCLGMILSQEVGRRIGLRYLARSPQKGLHGTGVIDGGIFAVWGLLLAFTFSGAANRFDERRSLVGQEANDVGTAYLRLDLLSPKAQEPLQQLFRQYLETRLETYQKASDEAAWKETLARSIGLQNEIWKQATIACQQANQPLAGMLLLPALNAMIDITTTRLVATKNHPPMVVYFLLLVLSFCCAMLIGFNQAEEKYRHWFHTSWFVMITTLIIYVIIDMEFPRVGLIRVDSIDQVLVQTLESMK